MEFLSNCTGFGWFQGKISSIEGLHCFPNSKKKGDNLNDNQNCGLGSRIRVMEAESYN